MRERSAMPPSPTSREVVTRYMKAIDAGDRATMRDCFAADATWTLAGNLPVSGTWKGLDGIFDGFFGQALDQLAPDSLSVEVTNIFAEGDQVAVEWTSKARTKRENKPYNQYAVGIFTVRDGKIQTVREYFDSDLERQI